MTITRYIADRSKPLETWAANSLQTSAIDYARFIHNWMNDKSLQNAFIPHVFMTQDKGTAGAIGVAKGKIPNADLSHVAWGLGWGLQVDHTVTGHTHQAKAVTAYHSGDMNEWRAWVAMNLEDKTAMVFFANAHNGHILAEQIIPPTIQLEHVANYFFSKWGFARNLDELGGVTNNLGLKQRTPASTPIVDQETTDSVTLNTAQETTQRYRDISKEAKQAHDEPAAAAEVTEHSSPSPLQTTPK